MSHAGRLMGRLFSLGLSCLLGLSAALAQTPALTTVSDTVYRADGAPASGTLLISWPAFTTADGHAVAAGTKSVPLASNGSFSLQLAPNAGGTPGVTYAVVYQLSDGTVKSEFWSVGTASPETSEAVRVTGGTCSGNGQGGTLRFTTVNSTPWDTRLPVPREVCRRRWWRRDSRRRIRRALRSSAR